LPPELLLLAQICTKSFVGWGFAPDSTGGTYSAPPDPLAGLRGPTANWRGGEGVPVKFWLGIHPWYTQDFRMDDLGGDMRCE